MDYNEFEYILKKEGAFNAFLREILKHTSDKNEKIRIIKEEIHIKKSGYDIINSKFHWQSSKQGRPYWHRIANIMLDKE